MDIRLDPTRFFGEVGGEPVALFRLRHANGMEVAICNLGAKVLQILVPDRDGALGDVALGYDSLAALQAGAPSMGAFIGRYAGRIAQARYTLDGTTYTLAPNAGPHALHGGPNGSRHRVFSAHQDTPDSLTLHLRFEPSVDGHPGIIDLTLSYRLTDDHTLVVEHDAVAVCNASPASPASFTPHIYFNLDGPGDSSIDSHWLQVFADRMLDADADIVATGERLGLDGHALDLRQARRLGDLPDIDHAYELGAPPAGQDLRRVAQAHSPRHGRRLEVWTTEPVMQVYTTGTMGAGATPDVGKGGVVHHPRSGLCLEPQQYPDAMHCPAFPLKRVGIGQPYRARTEYRFGTLA